MRKGRFIGSAALVAALAVPAIGQAQNLITNGTFETPDVPTFSDQVAPGSITGWTVIGTDVTLVDSSYLSPNQQANGGTGQWVDLTGHLEGYDKGVSQTFASTHNNFFLVEFDLGRKLDRDQATVAVSINGGTAVTFTNSDTGSGGQMDWNTYSYYFMGNGGPNQTITFLGATPGANNTIGLDNVKVTAVPEPSGIAMMLAGLAGLAFVARRRKA